MSKKKGKKNKRKERGGNNKTTKTLLLTTSFSRVTVLLFRWTLGVSFNPEVTFRFITEIVVLCGIDEVAAAGRWCIGGV